MLKYFLKKCTNKRNVEIENLKTLFLKSRCKLILVYIATNFIYWTNFLKKKKKKKKKVKGFGTMMLREKR